MATKQTLVPYTLQLDWSCTLVPHHPQSLKHVGLQRLDSHSNLRVFPASFRRRSSRQREDKIPSVKKPSEWCASFIIWARPKHPEIVQVNIVRSAEISIVHSQVAGGHPTRSKMSWKCVFIHQRRHEFRLQTLVNLLESGCQTTLSFGFSVHSLH